MSVGSRKNEERSSRIRQLFTSFHCPRWAELPDIELYMDQVVTFLNQKLSLVLVGEKPITPMMINNYVKGKALSAPVRKRYGREHLARLMMIFTLKKTMGLPDIAGLTEALQAYPDAQSDLYDSFCSAFEAALCGVSASAEKGEEGVPHHDPLLTAAVLSCAGKLYVQHVLIA